MTKTEKALVSKIGEDNIGRMGSSFILLHLTLRQAATELEKLIKKHF